MHHFVVQLASPQVTHRFVNVIGIADARHDAFRNVVENIFVSLGFVFAAPRRDRGMFGGGNTDTWHRGAVILLEQFDGCEIVGADEIEKVRSAANGCGFAAADSSKTEVVQLVNQQGRIAGAHQRFADDLLDGAT